MKELLDICAGLRALGNQPSALATVIDVQGSAYRRPGARMLLTPAGQSWGMISGGCLEQDLLVQVHGILHVGCPRILRYDSASSADLVFGTGTGCNGIVEVLVEPMIQEFRDLFIEAVETCNRDRERAGIATSLDESSGRSRCSRHAVSRSGGTWAGDPPLVRSLDGVFLGQTEKAFIADLGDGRAFIQPLLAPVHLLIFGAWLDAGPLLRMAKQVGFRVTVVDTRQRTSTRALFSEADEVLLCSPEEALSKVELDSRTAVVLMAHHFVHDEAALRALAVASSPKASPFYIGMLGPKQRRDKVLAALHADGLVVPHSLASAVHGPAGLDLGATSPETIALSIVAEVQATVTARSGAALSGCDQHLDTHLPKQEIIPVTFSVETMEVPA